MHILEENLKKHSVPYALPLPFALLVAHQKMEEKRLLKWLSGNPFGPREHELALVGGKGLGGRKRGAETKGEDAHRSRVRYEILPLLFKVAGLATPKGGSGGGGVYESSEQGLEVSRDQLKVLVAESAPFFELDHEGRRMLYVSGPRPLESWALHVLLGMLEEGRLSLIAECLCGCGRWFIKWRGDRRFFQESCSVKWHQAQPDFKEKRNERVRETRKVNAASAIEMKPKKQRAKRER